MNSQWVHQILLTLVSKLSQSFISYGTQPFTFSNMKWWKVNFKLKGLLKVRIKLQISKYSFFWKKRPGFVIFQSNTVKFVYSEKATKIFEISTLLLSVDKSKVEISQNFVAFSEYMNFTYT